MNDEVHDIHWHRRNNPNIIALNTAYGILINNSHCFADDVPLDDLAKEIANAILKGATTEKAEEK